MKLAKRLLLLPLFAMTLVGCGGNNLSSFSDLLSSSIQEKYNINDYVEIDLAELSLQEGDEFSLPYTMRQEAELSFEVDNENLFIEVNDESIYIKANKECEAALTIRLIKEQQQYLLGKKQINVVKRIFYLPVPEGKIILKGAGLSCSVRVYLLDESIGDNPVWSVSDDTIISLQTQGYVALISSLKRGISTVTFTLGGFSKSFDVYVTNMRGEV